jgi:hypothetical protein
LAWNFPKVLHANWHNWLQCNWHRISGYVVLIVMKEVVITSSLSGELKTKRENASLQETMLSK